MIICNATFCYELGTRNVTKSLRENELNKINCTQHYLLILAALAIFDMFGFKILDFIEIITRFNNANFT